MREVLYNYKTTQRYYDLDISFIKHQGTKNNVKRKGVFILPVAHLPRRSEKHGLCKIGGRGEGRGGEGDKQGVLRERYQWQIGHFRVTKYSHFQNKAYCRTFLMHFVRHRQINAPVYFVKHRQINAPVHFVRHRQINAPVYL